MYPIIFIKKFRKKFKSMHLYYNIYNLNEIEFYSNVSSFDYCEREFF